MAVHLSWHGSRWKRVEYIDSFGRTRTCQKRDLDDLKNKKQNANLRSSPSPTEPQSKMHEKWNIIEEETVAKKDVHYQDVLFDEARDHGAGFLSFSRDETERAEQLQFLKDVGEEGAKAAATKDATRRRKQHLMDKRLAKVRQRKRLKMGLPVKGDEDKYKTPPPSDDEEAEQVESVAAPVVVTETDASNASRSEKTSHVRAWDVGKPGVASTMSQEQWIASTRKKRDDEFAPPPSYQNESSPDRGYFSKLNQNRQNTNCYPTTSGETKHESEEDEVGGSRSTTRAEFAPPLSYEYYHSSTKKKFYSLGRKINIESAISKGLSQLRKDQR